ncbi:IS1096 element passenger TnpR family protein [Nocardia concava]|uniref:IS1096 element passenger TnpR family protein n=1 Tax=Nocardia concava TaxID=257281 RepID=UPI0012FBA83D|nr:hypothetical protein [Nocardia concava]
MAEEQPLLPSRRGPRRKKPVTYHLRVTIQGIDPPVFRWIEVSSELFLNDLNEVPGASIGWVNFAAHEFRCGPTFDDPTSERYVSADAVAHGDAAVAEDQVRLDELFTTPGDTLYYLYDYADYWMHHIVLDKILPRTAKTPRTICASGDRDGPPEGSGGPANYEYWCRRADPDDEGESLEYITPEALINGTEYHQPNLFVIEEINWYLTRQFGYGRGPK